MAETAAQLREEIEQRRQNVSETVDQIETRVNPTKAVRRSTSKIRRRLTDLKDRIMGNDEQSQPGYGYSRGGNYEPGGSDSESMMEKARHAVEDIEPGEYVRRQTRGNPLAAGLISFGAGVLVGSLLPETDQERRMVSNVEPQMEKAAKQAASMGEEVLEEVKDSAGQAATELKDEANQAVTEVAEEAKSATKDVKNSAT